MARDAHSASSLELGRACDHAWALRYIAGWKEVELSWDEIIAGVPYVSRQRSLALGKRLHALAELHYTHPEQFTDHDWQSLPGQMLSSGLHLLPARDRCVWLHAEHPLGARGADGARYCTEYVDAEGNPILRAGGVAWRGSKDIFACVSARELKRLGIETPLGLAQIMIIDHKSCSNIAQYAHTAATLVDDLQANIYALDACEAFGVASVRLRWVYYESKNVRRAVAVDCVILLADARRIVSAAALEAKRLDAIPSVEAAAKNTKACLDYGGRPCHSTQGGPCNVRIPASQLLRQHPQRKKAAPIMALSPETQARFDAMKKGMGAAPAAAPAKAKRTSPVKAKPAPIEVEEEVEETEEEETEEEAEATIPAPPPRGVKRAAAKVVPSKIAASAPELDADSDELLALAHAIRDAEAKIEALTLAKHDMVGRVVAILGA